MFPFCRLNANYSFKREPYRTKTLAVFRYLKLKTLIWRNLLEKREPYRDAFLFEKAIKTDAVNTYFVP
jgi:hypothetical protein